MASHRFCVWAVLCLAFFTVLGRVSSDSSDDSELLSILDFLELEYEDVCNGSAMKEWAVLEQKPKAFAEHMEAEKAFSNLVKLQANEVKNTQTGNTLIKRKIELLTMPGDTLLETDEWNKLVTFAKTSEYEMETEKRISCSHDQHKKCNLAEYRKLLADSMDDKLLSTAKKSWEAHLPDERKFATEMLPLVKYAAKANGFDTVRDYWEMLVEYEDAYYKANELWDSIAPLYAKLQKHVQKKLAMIHGDSEDKTIPSQWLGSLYGEDWINIAELVTEPKVYNKLNGELENHNIGGINTFKLASSTLSKMELGPIYDKFWKDSKFNKQCPLKLINDCQQEGMRVSTCSDINFAEFFNTYEAAMSVKHAQIKSQKMLNTYILKEANRYSALDESISGLGPLIASEYHQNSLEGLFFSQKDKTNTKIELQLLMALRDLPRLAYYLSADKWRLSVLENPGTKTIDAWSEYRKNISLVSTSKKDYLGDPNILYNKPYIGKFYGIILKYQLFEILTQNDNEVPYFEMLQSNSKRLHNIMERGFNQRWPAIISELAYIHEISSEALLDYYTTLSEYLDDDSDFKMNMKETVDEEEEEDEKIDEDRNLGEEDSNTGDDLNDDIEDHAEIQKEVDIATEKMLHINEERNKIAEKAKEESTTLNAFLIPKYSNNPAASSSDLSDQEKNDEIDTAGLQYVWIGLGVLLIVVIVLGVIVIGRKRYNHKKALERERKQGSA